MKLQKKSLIFGLVGFWLETNKQVYINFQVDFGVDRRLLVQNQKGTEKRGFTVIRWTPVSVIVIGWQSV
jgi:hypothetical protein